MTLGNGFLKKDFHKIKKDIELSLVSSLGEIDLNSPSVFANLVSIFAEREANIWQQCEAVYNASYPNTAEGYSLDGICAITGVAREVGTYSEVICQLTAVNYTKIPKNSKVKVKTTGNIFVSAHEVTINNEACHAINLQVNNASATSYQLNINNEKLVYDKLNGDDPKAIAKAIAGLARKCNTNLVIKDHEAEISITAKEPFETFSCFISDGIKIISCTNHVGFRSLEKGSIVAPAHSLTNIHTPLTGWIASNNITAAKVGNDLESDTDLRARRNHSVKLGGSGTLESIKSTLLNLTGVTSVTVYENSSNKLDSRGLPANSFEALITGGKNLDIARAIWQKKPAGIKTHGQISIALKDSSNKQQVVSFSRPRKVFVHSEIIITKTPSFNMNCLTDMQHRIIEQINRLEVGANVILKSLFLSIFSEQGIANAVVNLGSTLSSSVKPTLKENDIVIAESSVAITDDTKIIIKTEDF